MIYIFSLISEVEFVNSIRGGTCLILDGYKYNKHYTRGDKTRWRCSYSYACKCAAYVFTEDNKIYKRHGEHSHPRTESNAPSYGNAGIYNIFNVRSTSDYITYRLTPLFFNANSLLLRNGICTYCLST